MPVSSHYDRPVSARSWRSFILASLIAQAAAACAEAPAAPSPEETNQSMVSPLDLQVRNSGLPGGYLWLSVTGQPNVGRWHRFGMAEFICVTCPAPFVGSGASYEIAVFDESCQLRALHRPIGGQLLVEIDLGPTVRLVQAPPLVDWLPSDSAPADLASIPCSPP